MCNFYYFFPLLFTFLYIFTLNYYFKLYYFIAILYAFQSTNDPDKPQQITISDANMNKDGLPASPQYTNTDDVQIHSSC